MAFAQGGGGGRGQGMRGFGNNNSMTSLLSRADVRKELKITDEQSAKLAELGVRERGQRGQGGGQGRGQRGQGGQAGQGGQRGQGGQGGDPAAMQKAREEREKAIHAVLLEAQNKRLKELYVQRVSFRALMNAEIQADLKLDDAQKASIKDLQTKQQEANRAIFQRIQSQELTREEAMASIQKNEKVLTEELGKILKDGQKAQFEKMAGAKFEFDSDN